MTSRPRYAPLVSALVLTCACRGAVAAAPAAAPATAPATRPAGAEHIATRYMTWPVNVVIHIDTERVDVPALLAWVAALTKEAAALPHDDAAAAREISAAW